MQRDESELIIRRMPDGGFLVTGAFNHPGMMTPLMYASTTIDEALKYMKRKLTPAPSK